MIKSVKSFNLAESETLMDSTDSKILKMLSENQKAKGCCEKPRDVLSYGAKNVCYGIAKRNIRK